MELRSTTCPACGGRDFTVEELVEEGELTGLDLRCARGCGRYTYEAGDRSAWCGNPRRGKEGVSMTPNEYPATAECPQCGREVETTLYVNRDDSDAYAYGLHCPECDEAVAMDINFVPPGMARWSALRAWLIGERIALEGETRRMAPDPARSMRLRGRLDEAAMALQRMDDLEKADPPRPEAS